MRQLINYVQQFGYFQRNARLYLISNALSGVTTGILLVLYNLYLLSLGYGADFIGLVLFVGTIGAGIAIFPAGVCIDRFGGKAVLIWSNFLIGFAGIGQILFHQSLPLLLSAFAAGTGVAGAIVVNAPFLTLNSTPDERSHLFSLNIALGLVTTVLGNIVGGILPVYFRSFSWLMSSLRPGLDLVLATQPEARSYQLSLLFAGIIAVPSLVPLFMLQDKRTLPGSNNEGRAKRTLWPSFSKRDRGWEQDFLPETHISLSFSAWLSGRLFVSIRTILFSAFFLLMLVQALIGAGAGLFVPYFNIYFVQQLKASPALFGLLNGGATAITALLTLVAPWLARRIGKVNAVVVTQISSIPLLVMIGLVPLLPVAAILYLLRQGLMDMSAGVLQVFSMEAVVEEHRGIANSGYQTAFLVPWAVMAPLGGLIITHAGYPAVFIGGALFYILAVSVLWWNFGRGRGNQVKPVNLDGDRAEASVSGSSAISSSELLHT
ncbi:MAG TPA: MFS transporter [Ktedonobacteraceae bacterium]|nr:MFS transporter [Ktedonobacteraceae bacterium]